MTQPNTQQDIARNDTDLNQLILAGKALEAFEKYYAEDVIMQEGLAAPYEGKAFNRQREKDFLGSIEAVHSFELKASAVAGDRSFSEWVSDVTLKNGTRLTGSQIAARQWKDGKIVWERFYSAGK